MDATTNLGIPFAEDSDPADAPALTQAMAEYIEELILVAAEAEGAGLPVAGDFKVSSRAATHGRWLLCDGSEKTQAEIEAACGIAAEQAAELAALWGTGGSSIYGSAAVGKIQLPDARNRAVSIVGPAGLPGLTQRDRGSAYGAETHQLTGNESGVKAHGHGVSQTPHSHTADQSAHSHSVTDPGHDHTGVVSANGEHRHEVHAALLFNTSQSGAGQRVWDLVDGDTPADTELFSSMVPDHQHAVIPDTTGISIGSTDPAISVGTANAALTVNNHAGESAGAAHNNVDPKLALGSLFVRV